MRERIALDDAIARVLLRYFRKGKQANIERARVDKNADREFLLAHWAMSPTMLEFWRFLIEHKHELEMILTSGVVEGTAGIRGRVDALATATRQRLTGNPALFVYREPRRTYDRGPNRLVAWVLRKSQSVVEALAAAGDSTYGTMREEALKLMHDARRVEAILVENGPTSDRATVSDINKAGCSFPTSCLS